MTLPPVPTKIQRRTQSNQLHLEYANTQYDLSAEFLRISSPSAEVRQHGNPILVEGKSDVVLTQVELVGRYGIKLTFDDGHDTGIYSWAYLDEITTRHDVLWQNYCESLHEQKKSRHPQTQVVQIQGAQTQPPKN